MSFTKNVTSTTWDFVKNVSMDEKLNARVLLTHIPLFRPDRTPCGPHRIINQVSRAVHCQDIVSLFDKTMIQNYKYQNYVTEESSKLLSDLIGPVLILSDHDMN